MVTAMVPLLVTSNVIIAVITVYLVCHEVECLESKVKTY